MDWKKVREFLERLYWPLIYTEYRTLSREEFTEMWNKQLEEMKITN